MPSGKKDIYGVKSKALYKAGDMAGEIGAQRNAAAAARMAGRKPDAAKIMAREGTTSASGGRPATKTPAKAAPTKMPAKVAPSKAPVAKSPVTKMPLKQQVTRTTTAYRPTPMGKKK